MSRSATFCPCAVIVTIVSAVLAAPSYGQAGACRITDRPIDYGQWLQQAKCLLRPVLMYRMLGPAPESLPEPLETLIGRDNVLDKAVLKRYLLHAGVGEASVGGNLDSPISKARYFIIHDTSSPNFLRGDFPLQTINSGGWNSAQIEALRGGGRTHVWIDRLGESFTSKDYGLETEKAGVKLEVRHPFLKGMMLHNELVQPRRCDPEKKTCCRTNRKGLTCNDAAAPEPGFTVAQYDRLALLYVIASARRGRWLIPGYHAVVDDEFGSSAHDDPQHFDIEVWASRLKDLLSQMNSNSQPNRAH